MNSLAASLKEQNGKKNSAGYIHKAKQKRIEYEL